MRADEPVYEWEGFLCRRHPNRLIPENYRIPGQPVLTTICAKDKQPVLTCDRIRDELIEALPVAAEIAACELIAWCLMADHLHVLLRVAEQGGDILALPSQLQDVDGETDAHSGCPARMGAQLLGQAFAQSG